MNYCNEEYRELTPYEEHLLDKIYNLEIRIHELETENFAIYDKLHIVEGD